MRYATILAAAAVLGMSSGAFGAIVEGSDVCGELPNVKWSWAISYGEPVLSGGDTSTTIVGDVNYNPQGNTGTADVTTTTSALIATTTATCTAMNPAGKINEDHSTTAETTTEIAPASSSTTNQTVCNPGASLPNCPLP